MRILLTSPSRSVALALARLLSSHGHDIIGLQLNERIPSLAPARFSKAYTQVLDLHRHTQVLKNLIPTLDLVIPLAETQETSIETSFLEKVKKTSDARIIGHNALLQDEELWSSWCEAMDLHGFADEGPAVGGVLFQAHVLVMASTIRTFLVTTSADGLRERDFIMVPAGDWLHDVLFHYTQAFLDALVQQAVVEMDEGAEGFNTHLSVTFSICERVMEDGSGVQKLVRPVSCVSGVHDSLILLIRHLEDHGRMGYLEEAYTDSEVLCTTDAIAVTLPVEPGLLSSLRGTYSLPRVLLELVQILWRLFRAPLNSGRWRELANLIMMMLVWGLWFKEERWDARDSWPAVAHWCVGIPWKGVVLIWEMECLCWVRRGMKPQSRIWARLWGAKLSRGISR